MYTFSLDSLEKKDHTEIFSPALAPVGTGGALARVGDGSPSVSLLCLFPVVGNLASDNLSGHFLEMIALNGKADRFGKHPRPIPQHSGQKACIRHPLPR